ncbi:cora-domain-containing protein [Xylariaceae sp. FL0594]|nr:cora-domain-containing protein [Xylariaceae sp. FL0594]
MAGNPYTVLDSQSRASPAVASSASASQAPKKKHRAGRKHKKNNRRKSFAVSTNDMPGDIDSNEGALRTEFYTQHRNPSNTSIESEALLDHREQRYTRPRRPSAHLGTSFSMTQSHTGHFRMSSKPPGPIGDGSESTPLLSTSRLDNGSPRSYGLREGIQRNNSPHGSNKSSNRLYTAPLTPGGERHNVNYPPSVPGTPPLGPSDRDIDMNFGDAMMRDRLSLDRSRSNSVAEEDHEPPRPSTGDRRATLALQAAEDVCFPQENMSEMAEDDLQQARDKASMRTRRRHRAKWPELDILEEWARLEQEDMSNVRRMKKITEPQLVNGRLRPVHKNWFRIEEDAPYRFTYFNEELQSTIHSQTISELVPADGTFRDLFIPDPPILVDSSEEDGDEDGEELLAEISSPSRGCSVPPTIKGLAKKPSRQAELSRSPLEKATRTPSLSKDRSSGSSTKRGKSPLTGVKSPSGSGEKKPRFGERPVWWLDVLSPTDAEMKVLAKAFGIHPLTSEDIMLQEQREKVELFRHYYFVNYRSFDQDAESENHLEPVNMYVVVFREGVISFHFSQTPHPANVRRRIRQLKDFMVLSSDWISYAIIDDITDVYLPLIQTIEDEVDDIDDKILEMHSSSGPEGSSSGSQERGGDDSQEKSIGGADGNPDDRGDMLRRVGDCRKKVMILYRLLGNKADVIKGFAKRCNEHWEVAPRSEIGLYLGDIQDHIVTMTGNLSHYEMILARCHANYIAQINIRMNERAEQTADTLGKLTVLGTIVVPMNIVTGLWGMNVFVPGQDDEGSLNWFFCITTGLAFFGLACYLVAKRVYGIV